MAWGVNYMIIHMQHLLKSRKMAAGEGITVIIINAKWFAFSINLIV